MLRVMQITERLVDCIIKTENERSLSIRALRASRNWRPLVDASVFDRPRLHVRLRPSASVRKACWHVRTSLMFLL